jgi:peptidoglycan/LPS O-acetylase OafA/YrhL
VRRRLAVLALLLAIALAAPAVAFAHDQPETDKSRWVMADWMLDTFFVFAGLALVAFVAAWKSGAFHELDSHASIPLLVEEEDYYTPDWALDEEEWA